MVNHTSSATFNQYSITIPAEKYNSTDDILQDGPYKGSNILAVYLREDYQYLIDLIDKGEWGATRHQKSQIRRDLDRQIEKELESFTILNSELDYTPDY